MASLLILVAGFLVFALAAGALHFALRPVTLRIAVGPSGSDDAKLVQAMTQLFAREGSPVQLSPIVTDGAVESIALLKASKADLAVARGDLELPSNADSVAILRKNVVVLWAPSKPLEGAKKGRPARIKEISDLAGHRVGVIGRTQANLTLLNIILKESGVAPEKVATTQFAVNQIEQLAHDPAIDAFMSVGPLDSKITSEAIQATASARGEPKFLPVDVSEAIAQRHPLYESEEIPGSTFSSSPARPDDKVETISVNHLIIAPSSLSETTVGSLIRELFAARQRLAKELPGAAHIEKPDTDKDAALPAHPGAAAYIDGTERTFLDKYSDFIWGGILLLSGLGSALAWLRHYFQRDEKDRNTVHRARLLAAITEVRQANSLDELAAMQRQVDDVLRETLDCYDDGVIEDGDLAAFGLVLDQFHYAVTDRRAALGAGAASQPEYGADRLRVSGPATVSRNA